MEKATKEMLKLTTLTTAHQELIDMIKTAYDSETGKFKVKPLWDMFYQGANPPAELIFVDTYAQHVCNNADIVLSKFKQLLSLANINTTTVIEKILQPLINTFHNLLTEDEVKFYGLPPRQRVYRNTKTTKKSN